jgi:thiosulfate/3-mercaptopyruvate sulfurtransferase
MSLIDVASLAAQLGDPNLVICDCRFDLKDPSWGRRTHAEASIPGAIYIDLDHDLSGPIPIAGTSRSGGRHPLPRIGSFRERMTLWGMGTETRVVAFDHRGGPFAARLWWMLRAAGYQQVAVLDGGIDAWTAAGHALEPGRIIEGYEGRAELPIADRAWPGTIDASTIVTKLGELCLFDARAPERFAGEVEPLDRFAGHIPGAHNTPFGGNLVDGRFASAEALRDRFEKVFGDAPPEARVAYCGSGVTACHNLLALEIAGLEPAALYPGSWSDWISDETRPREPNKA